MEGVIKSQLNKFVVYLCFPILVLRLIFDFFLIGIPLIG